MESPDTRTWYSMDCMELLQGSCCFWAKIPVTKSKGSRLCGANVISLRYYILRGPERRELAILAKLSIKERCIRTPIRAERFLRLTKFAALRQVIPRECGSTTTTPLARLEHAHIHELGKK